MRYGFVGLGNLGKHLAANLSRGNADVRVTAEKRSVNWVSSGA